MSNRNPRKYFSGNMFWGDVFRTIFWIGMFLLLGKLVLTILRLYGAKI